MTPIATPTRNHGRTMPAPPRSPGPQGRKRLCWPATRATIASPTPCSNGPSARCAAHPAPAPTPGSAGQEHRPPSSAPPARQPPSRDPPRLPQAPHPLRRAEAWPHHATAAARQKTTWDVCRWACTYWLRTSRDIATLPGLMAGAAAGDRRPAAAVHAVRRRPPSWSVGLPLGNICSVRRRHVLGNHGLPQAYVLAV